MAITSNDDRILEGIQRKREKRREIDVFAFSSRDKEFVLVFLVFKFEMTKIDGPHHLQMTHVDDVLERIERFLLDHPDPIFVRSKI